jgi:O-antigen/teichoic acid export membrane protein
VPAANGGMTVATGATSPPRRTGQVVRAAFTRSATVGDQVLVALTNFGLTIAIGRAFGADELAAYGIGLSIGLMVQGLHRHAVTIPLMLRTADWVNAQRRAVVGEQVLVLIPGLLVAFLALLVAQFSLSRFAHLVLLSSAVCLLIYLQLEFARAFLIKIGRPGLLLACALLYAAVTTVLAIMAIQGYIGFEIMLAGSAVTMLVHALVVVVAGGGISARAGSRLLADDAKHYGGWAVVATGTYAGYNHAPLLILGAIAGVGGAAVFVAARSLLQPLQILLRGLDVADKNTFAELKSGNPAPRFILRLVLIYAAVGIVLAGALGFAAEWLLAFAYGPKFAGHGAAVVAWAPAYVLLSVSMPLESLVYAQKRFAAYYAIRAAASLAAIIAALPLIHFYGAVGAITACAIGWFVAVVGTGLMLMRKSTPQ